MCPRKQDEVRGACGGGGEEGVTEVGGFKVRVPGVSGCDVVVFVEGEAVVACVWWMC